MARHGVRIAIIWLVLSVIAEVLVGILPIPSPDLSQEAVGAHQTIYMLFYLAMPIFVFVWVLFAYSIIVFRHRGPDDDVDRPTRPDGTPPVLLWGGISFLLVLFLAGWGTFTLKEITTPPTAHAVAARTLVRHGKKIPGQRVRTGQKLLDVQVIGQQWEWTYRYPSYGGIESNYLELPVETPIRFDITSLDVVHSFWIYNYDIKEDAVPGVVNTAYMEADTTGSSTPDGKFWVVCNELCGLWHGYMRTKLFVVPQTAFTTWATKAERYEKSVGITKNLPRYSGNYYPQPDWPPAPQDQSP